MALAALEKLASRGVIKPKERVVVVSTALGLKFVDFKVRYHEGKLPGVEGQYRNHATQVPATLGAVQDAIAALQR